MRYTMDTGLSDNETYAIGLIVSQWGFLETEIFHQTLMSYGEDDVQPGVLKKNVQFTEVLKLWKSRVAEKASGDRKHVLLSQYEKIKKLGKFRHAVVHSRWEWNPNTVNEIKAVRIHNKQIKTVKFTTEDLADFANTLGEVRYNVLYPGGLEDRAEAKEAADGQISRAFWNMLTGNNALTDNASSAEND